MGNSDCDGKEMLWERGNLSGNGNGPEDGNCDGEIQGAVVDRQIGMSGRNFLWGFGLVYFLLCSECVVLSVGIGAASLTIGCSEAIWSRGGHSGIARYFAI